MDTITFKRGHNTGRAVVIKQDDTHAKVQVVRNGQLTSRVIVIPQAAFIR